MNLERVDRLTQKGGYPPRVFRDRLYFDIPHQERRVLVHGAEMTECGCFRFAAIKDCLRQQHSYTASLLGRLVKRNILKRVGRGMYLFCDIDFLNHILARRRTNHE